MSEIDDSYVLKNILVAVEGDPGTFACSHELGPAFSVVGENIIFDQGPDRFSMYALAAVLPFFPAKQRTTHENDWMSTDDKIACPDPNCGAQFKISNKELGERTERHSETTKVPLPGVDG